MPVKTYTLEYMHVQPSTRICRLPGMQFLVKDTIHDLYATQMRNFGGLHHWEQDGLASRLQAGCMRLRMRTPRPVTCTTHVLEESSDTAQPSFAVAKVL